MSINLKPIPSDPLPIFRPSQYGWQNAPLSYKEGDIRYFLQIGMPTDIICQPGGTFGVKTIRITGDQFDSVGKLVGYSSTGIYQVDLAQFYTATNPMSTNWLGAIVFLCSDRRTLICTTGQYGGISVTNSARTSSAIQMRAMFYRFFTLPLCERLVSGFRDLSGGSLYNFNFTRGICIVGQPCGSQLMNISIMLRQSSCSYNSSNDPVTSWTSQFLVSGSDFVDIIYSRCFRRICWVNQNNTGSNMYWSQPTTFGSLGSLTAGTITPLASYRCIAENYRQGLLAMGSTASRCAVSSDGGSTWTSTSTPFIFKRMAYSYALDLFVAVSNSTDPTKGRVAYSSDGLTWSSVGVTGIPSTTLLQDICYVEELDLLVACCTTHTTNNRIFTSRDAKTWTEQTTPNNNDYNAVRWFPELGMFIAVAISGTNKMITSYDGVNWTERLLNTAGKPYTDVMFNPRFGRLILAHNGNYAIQSGRWIGCPKVNAN